MRIMIVLITFLITTVFSISCTPKKETNKNNTIKESSSKEKKANKKNILTTKEIKNLSDIFIYGDTLIKERREYQKEISELSKSLKNIKTPFLLKENSKYKYTRVSYFSNSVWISIYSNAEKKEIDRLFWVVITYKHNISKSTRKSYNNKFAGLNAKHFKDSWAWLLLKGDIEIKISATIKETKNDKYIKALTKEFNIKAIESIFTKKTKYSKLKKYLLKIKAINKKITDINNKFKEKEKDASLAFAPFLNTKGFLKNYNLSKIYYTSSNSFSIYIKKDKKQLATLYIGRANLIGASTYFRRKNIKTFKLEGFSSVSLKNNLVIVKLPTLAVKATSYLKDGFATEENLKKAVSSILLPSLSKVK